jgi:hypothetical protein
LTANEVKAGVDQSSIQIKITLHRVGIERDENAAFLKHSKALFRAVLEVPVRVKVFDG